MFCGSEWQDGVLTAAARAVVKEPLNVRSWIVCDGDVDPEWIESLNSVRGGLGIVAAAHCAARVAVRRLVSALAFCRCWTTTTC